MPKCPKCKSEIDHLICSETRTDDFKATYDVGMDEFDYENVEEWRGNPTGTMEKQEFSCPKCHVTLFTDEEAAKAFFSGIKIEQS